MAESSRSATRGRRYDSDFAKVLAGPHYWISVRTLSGRVVRIPVKGKRGKGYAKVKRGGTVNARPFNREGKGGAAGAAGGRPKVDRSGFGKQVESERLKTRFIPYTKDQSAAIAERLKTVKSRVKFHRGSINDASFAASTLAKGSGVPQYVSARQTGFVIESARPTTGSYVVATKTGMRKIDDAAARARKAAALRAARAAKPTAVGGPVTYRAVTSAGNAGTAPTLPRNAYRDGAGQIRMASARTGKGPVSKDNARLKASVERAQAFKSLRAREGKAGNARPVAAPAARTIAPRAERPGYDRRNTIDSALGRSPAESRAQLALQARAKRAMRPKSAAKPSGTSGVSRQTPAASAPPLASARGIAPRSERPGYDRRNALDSALGRSPEDARRNLAVQARAKRAMKPKTGDALGKEMQAARRAEAARLRQFRAKRIAERAAIRPGMEEIGGRYPSFGRRAKYEYLDARKNATPAYRDYIRKTAAQRAARPAPAASPAPASVKTASGAKPSAGPSLREQAAARRASKIVAQVKSSRSAFKPDDRPTTKQVRERREIPLSGSTVKSLDKVYLSGNTFAHKDAIKALGGKWDKDRKEWTVPAVTSMRGRGDFAHTLNRMRGVRVEAMVDREITVPGKYKRAAKARWLARPKSS
jgi:hypothetical protein